MGCPSPALSENNLIVIYEKMNMKTNTTNEHVYFVLLAAAVLFNQCSDSSTTKVQPVQIQDKLQNTETHIICMKSGDISLAGRLSAFFGRCGCRSVWRFRRSHLSLKYVGISFPFVMNVTIIIIIVRKIIVMIIVMTFLTIMTLLLPWTS